MSVSPDRTTMIIRRPRFLIFFFVTAAVIFTAIPNFAQDQNSAQEKTPTYGPKKKEHGPRAVGVLEWTGQGPRLVPITIKINDQFYDAGIYQAQPVPMALDAGVIYEVQKSGEPLGDFTLEAAQQTPNGNWLGVGKFDSKADQQKRKESAAKAAAAEVSAKADEDKDDRPVLHRSKPKTDEPASSTQSAAPSATPASAPGTSPASPTQQKAESKPAQPSAPAPLTETSSDPERPTLKRGKEKEEQAVALDNKPIPMKKLTPPPPGLSKIQVAVSDASFNEPHDYKWSWANPDEQKKLRSQAEKLALDTVASYAAKLGGPKPGKLEDIDMQVYDLSYSNAPDVILSARVLPEAKPVASKKGTKTAETPTPSSGFEYYVTVVGREDIYAQLQKSFVIASDNKHLDAFPRMQLIDIVDVDGNGSGDLLFRSTSDTGSSFVIYRDLGYRLNEVIRVPEPKS